MEHVDVMVTVEPASLDGEDVEFVWSAEAPELPEFVAVARTLRELKEIVRSTFTVEFRDCVPRFFLRGEPQPGAAPARTDLVLAWLGA